MATTDNEPQYPNAMIMLNRVQVFKNTGSTWPEITWQPIDSTLPDDGRTWKQLKVIAGSFGIIETLVPGSTIYQKDLGEVRDVD